MLYVVLKVQFDDLFLSLGHTSLPAIMRACVLTFVSRVPPARHKRILCDYIRVLSWPYCCHVQCRYAILRDQMVVSQSLHCQKGLFIYSATFMIVRSAAIIMVHAPISFFFCTGKSFSSSSATSVKSLLTLNDIIQREVGSAQFLHLFHPSLCFLLCKSRLPLFHHV